MYPEQGMIFWRTRHWMFKLFPIFFFGWVVMNSSAQLMAEEFVPIAYFSKQDMTGWESKVFEGKTHYKLVRDDKTFVLQAKSHAAASGVFRKVHIDLNKTPYLHWSWKIQNVLQGYNERSKQGDDYVARVYVVFSGGMFFWRTRAINYVWASNQIIGSTWENPYTSHARMIAVQAGNAKAGTWQLESRNIQYDYQRLFGEPIDTLDSVAIMTDTDNTGASLKAWYGDIWMSSSSK